MDESTQYVLLRVTTSQDGGGVKRKRLIPASALRKMRKLKTPARHSSPTSSASASASKDDSVRDSLDDIQRLVIQTVEEAMRGVVGEEMPEWVGSTSVYVASLTLVGHEENPVFVMYFYNEALLLVPVSLTPHSGKARRAPPKTPHLMTPKVMEQRKTFHAFLSSVDLEIADREQQRKHAHEKTQDEKLENEIKVYNTFREMTIKAVEKHVGDHVMHIYLMAEPLDERTEKGKTEDYTVRSFLVRDGHSNQAQLFKLNMRDMVMSCRTPDKNGILVDGIDMMHMQEVLVPPQAPRMHSSVLVVLAYVAGKLQGIRVTLLQDHNHEYAITGKYLCAKGYGAILQQETEVLLRTHFAAYGVSNRGPFQAQSYGVHKRTSRAPAAPPARTLFRLNAVPSAVGFWQKMGFHPDRDAQGKEVILQDADGKNLHPMWKDVYPADAVSRRGSQNT